jgi:hypothetical protein
VAAEPFNAGLSRLRMYFAKRNCKGKNRRNGGGYHSQSASPCEGCAEINITNHYRELWAINGSLTLSTTNPFGTSDEMRISARIAPILPLENRQKKSSNVS